MSANQILIGLAGDLSGPASASMTGFLPAATARIDMQNAQGGVNGRQLKLVSADDQSTPQGGLTAVSELIQSKGVFGILEDSTQLNLGDKIAHQSNVPLVGAAIDGIDWGTQPYTNMVSTGGDLSPVGFPQYTSQVKVIQLAGGKNAASLAIANIPPSTTSGKEFTAAGNYSGSTSVTRTTASHSGRWTSPAWFSA